MSSSDPHGWADRVVGVCISLLVGATALFIAVKLIEAVWPVLLGLIAVGAFVAAGIGIVRARNRGW